ncbi:MAG: hypothetical protein RL685_2330 [Pseudomonadota bacterium]
MPSLRQRLSKPQPWLLVLLLLFTGVSVDAFRGPSAQWSARAWSAGIEGYRSLLRPLLRDHVRCRFAPSCSEYSQQAVQRFGIGKGLALTVDRLARCTGAMPDGTLDPLPPLSTEPLGRP